MLCLAVIWRVRLPPLVKPPLVIQVAATTQRLKTSLQQTITSVHFPPPLLLSPLHLLFRWQASMWYTTLKAELWDAFLEISAEKWESLVPFPESTFDIEQCSFYLEIREKKKSHWSQIHKIIPSRFKDESGIVRCASKASCEEVASLLQDTYGIWAEVCHAGMSRQDRVSVCGEWMTRPLQIIVTTVSLIAQRTWRGSDSNLQSVLCLEIKKAVHFLIHETISKSLDGQVTKL